MLDPQIQRGPRVYRKQAVRRMGSLAVSAASLVSASERRDTPRSLNSAPRHYETRDQEQFVLDIGFAQRS
jgi:hypothetical protein